MSKKCSVYLAQPMTGYSKNEAIELAEKAVNLCLKYGLSPWSPVLEEKIMRGNGVIDNTKVDLDWKWEQLDKQALNDCFALVNLLADAKSFGCEQEFGRHRYSEWQPSFLVSPKHGAGYVSISNYQADGIFGEMEACFAHVAENFGKQEQRRAFKYRVWKRFPYWLYRQLRRLAQ